MGLIEPRRVHVEPPSPEEVAASRARIDALRAEQAARAESTAPARRCGLEAGPALRDLDAAMRCACSCHPRPAQLGLHDGGTSCPCQLTRTERRAALEELFASSAELGDLGAGEAVDELHATAAELGVTVAGHLLFAPLVVHGHLASGRGFALRERHGSYRVTLAPPEDPARDPWEGDHDGCVDVAAGDESELTDAEGRVTLAQALRVAVALAGLAERRESCTHDRARPGDSFCAHCGTALA